MESAQSLYDKLAEDALRITADLIDAHGPRVSGTAGNRSACAALKSMLGERCDSAREEPFWIRPGSLFAIGKIFAILYLVGLVALLTGRPLYFGFGLFAMTLGLAYFSTHFLLYLGAFDFLLKKAQASNIVGTIDPKSRAERQVIVVGHHDSAPIYPFYESLSLIYSLRLFAAILSYLFCLAVLALDLYASITGSGALPPWTRYLAIAGCAFAIPMFAYMSKRGSPGAGDNLIACAIGLKIAELYRCPEARLESTRLVILLTDGEEVGQKGAASFVKDNAALLSSADTSIVNLDSIYSYEDLVLLKRDRNGFTKLSTELATDIEKVALGLGLGISIAAIPFLGGGTDGAQFARKGYRTASIIAQPIKVFSKEILFHTMKDMPDRISKKAVGAVIELVAEYIKAIDSSAINDGDYIRERARPS
jgi:aminopeptidase YwaD